jgi:hypothetical protein
MGLSGAIGDGTSIQTADDGNAAMLIDQRSVVELCSSTVTTLTRRPDTGGRVIQVGAGTTRLIVEPRSNEEHIQIHTPAAIATILGTVVYVTVDPATGETTIASEDNEVKIESADPNVAGSATISGSEEITMRPGEAPAAPKRIARSALANRGGCLMDFHDLGMTLDRVSWNGNVGTKLALADAEVANLPGVGSSPSGQGGDLLGIGSDLTDPIEIFGDAPPPETDPPCDIPGGCDPIFDPEPPCTIPGGCEDLPIGIEVPVFELPDVEPPASCSIPGGCDGGAGVDTLTSEGSVGSLAAPISSTVERAEQGPDSR